MKLPYAELHAFPDGARPHSGNPAGVVLLEAPLSDADMLGIAQSNNLAETAYLVADDAQADVWSLRWFTPGNEVDLCGHATMASAVWLFEEGHVKGDAAGFETRSGRLTVTRSGDDLYAMDFPKVPWRPGTARDGVVAAVGAGAPEAVFDVEEIHGAPYQFLLFANEAGVAQALPDLSALRQLGVNVVISAPGTVCDYVCRFFAPVAGVPEDPVTGSAHCTLAPFWAERLGKAQVSARQIGPRAGALAARIDNPERVTLLGTAARYLDGTIRL